MLGRNEIFGVSSRDFLSEEYSAIATKRGPAIEAVVALAAIDSLQARDAIARMKACHFRAHLDDCSGYFVA